jgi:DNA-binding MarR family transcriptional regulator
MNATPEQVACQVLEVVPLIMRAIREQMRANRDAEVSVPQFRALAFLDSHDGASLTAVADHIGLTLPSMSKLIDGLVDRKLARREFDALDRRRVTLGLTPRGRAVLQTSRDSTQAYLAEVCTRLAPTERATVMQALQALRPLFQSEREMQIQTAQEHNGHS